MKYEFHVGDYVETTKGAKGYISDVRHLWWTCTDAADGYNRGAVYNISGVEDDNVGFFYNRVGQYDFTKVNEIKPLPDNDGPMYPPSWMWKKINELIDAVNELRAAQKGEE